MKAQHQEKKETKGIKVRQRTLKPVTDGYEKIYYQWNNKKKKEKVPLEIKGEVGDEVDCITINQ